MMNAAQYYLNNQDPYSYDQWIDAINEYQFDIHTVMSVPFWGDYWGE
jgi:hypothetical protein